MKGSQKNDQSRLTAACGANGRLTYRTNSAGMWTA
jgi:hypothetical protein